VEVIEDDGDARRRQRGQLAKKGTDHVVPRRASWTELAEQAMRKGRESRIRPTPCRDQVRKDRRPPAIRFLQPIPKDAQAGSPREISQQGGLAVAGLSDHQDEAGMDLGLQPVQQPGAGQRVFPEHRELNLGRLNGIARHGRDPDGCVSRCDPYGRVDGGRVRSA
jgi:hypothetical protein